MPGEADGVVRLAGSQLGLSVCEDAWAPGPPFDAYAERRIPIILNINGSPFHRGKAGERLDDLSPSAPARRAHGSST